MEFYILILVLIIAAIIIAIIIFCCYGKIKDLSRCKDVEYGIIESRRPTGLKNIRQYCYMNSMMQAMASNEILIKKYNDIIQTLQNNYKCEKMIMFTKLLENINNSKEKTMEGNTEDLQALMTQVQWNTNSQEDTFQLLSSFINVIQRDVKEELLEKNITMPPKMKLLHSFTESSDYNKVQEHLALALPLCGDFRNQPGVKLKTLMDAFFESSPIDDGQYKTQISLFQKAPDILILHIQANEWDDSQRTYIKPKYYIIYEGTMEYAFNIHMKKDGSEIKKTKVVYKLTAVVHHMGSIYGGHYVTYRTLEGSWYLTNDSQVEEVSFNYDKAPYVMVYEKSKEI